MLLALLALFAQSLGCEAEESDVAIANVAPDQAPLLREAGRLVREGEFAAALDVLRPEIEEPAATTPALTMYGSTQIANKRPSLAVWSLARAADREDRGPNTRLAYVRSLISGGDELAAIEVATRYLEDSPDDPGLLDLRAQAYKAALDYENALADLEILADENPGVAILVERILNLHIQLEEWDLARERIAELRGLLSREGVDPESRLRFCATAGLFEQQRGEFEAAESILAECLEEAPADPNLVFAYVGLLDATNRVDEATAFLVERVESYPKRQALVGGYAERLADLGRDDEADAVLLEAARNDLHQNLWLALANLRLERGDLEGTVEAMDAAVEAATGHSPDEPSLEWEQLLAESRIGIGDVYVRAGHYERAQRIIESLSDEPALGLFLSGRVKLEQGDPAGALEDYQEAFKTYPSNPGARYLAGRAAVELGEFDLAIEYYQDALRASPEGTDAGFVLAHMLAAEGRLTWALDALVFRVARTPGGDPRGLRMLARLGAAAGIHGYAEGIRANLAESDVAWAGIALADQAADIAVLAGREQAMDYLEASELLEAPTHYAAFSAWYHLGLALGNEKEEAARAGLSAWAEANPDVAGVWLVKGRAYALDGEFEAALGAFEKALELNEQLTAAHLEQARVLVRLGQVDAALESFDRATELEPLDETPAFEAAQALFEAERLDEAAERIRALLVPHPWHGKSALLMVDIARNRGELEGDEAYAMARRAHRYHQNSGPRAHVEFGNLAALRGEHETALAAFNMAIAKLTDPTAARYGRAKALAALGRNAEAIQELDALLGLDTFDAPLEASALLETLRAQEAG